MHCIRCKGEMNKKGLKGILVDYCKVCDAFWLDDGELEAIEKGMAKSKDALRQEVRKEVIQERKRAVIVFSSCPKCQGSQIQERKMDGVTVDFCKKCHGIYFDHGELDEILKNRELDFFTRLKKQLFG